MSEQESTKKSGQNSLSKTFVWILLALLILGLGGFGVTNLGGSVQSVATVDGKKVDVNEYYQGVQQELNAIQQQFGQRLSFAQAQQVLNVDQQVLNRLLNQRALDAEAERLALSMGDENLRDQIVAIPAFQGLDGSFDRDAYSFALQQSGLSDEEFEISLREDAARSLLQNAIIGGIRMPSAYADTLVTYFGETRGFSIATLEETHLDAPIETADDATLQAYYDANTDDFMRPATRDITYAWLSPDMIIDSVEVDETALQELYEARDAEFNQPERRLVERLVFSTAEDAATAAAEVAAGAQTFEALVEARGLDLADVDLGDVTATDLSGAADIVFAADSGAVVGPAPTDLGPALFRINAILPAQSTSFEDALPVLREELAAERARRVIDAQIDNIDDLLAGGATLEEVADETDMELGTISYHTGLSDGIAGYADFREVAGRVTLDDFPEIASLDDGGIFALRLEGETDAAPAPFADAKAEVETAWRTSEVETALGLKADALLSQMAAGADIITLGLNVAQERDITRSDFVPDVPADLVQTVFEMDLGETRAIADDGRVLIVELDSIDAADLTNPELQSLQEIVAQQVDRALAEEIYGIYAAQIRAAADVNIDEAALAAINAQLQ